MGKPLRYAANVLANWLEDAAERAVAWLRAKGERPRRPRPLVFPSPLWVQMMDLNDKMIRAMAPQIAANILGGLPKVYGTDRSEAPVKIRIPADG